MTELGNLFTIERFILFCTDGYFIDDDGCGVYSDGINDSDEDVYPSLICKGLINRKYSHVRWFNK